MENGSGWGAGVVNESYPALLIVIMKEMVALPPEKQLSYQRIVSVNFHIFINFT
jgi:hypothetical protein